MQTRNTAIEDLSSVSQLLVLGNHIDVGGTQPLAGLIAGVRTGVDSAIVNPPNKIDVSDPEQLAQFLSDIQTRLSQPGKNHKRPKHISPSEVKAVLETRPDLIWSLARMEETGGEPDIIEIKDGALIFADCSADSPIGRRDLDYHQVVAMAKRFGAHIMPEYVYMRMQNTGDLDQKSWSWLRATATSRKDCSALNGLRRGFNVRVYPRKMDYHSKDMGWRAVLRVLKA
jgi:hypothetical protein